MDIKKKSKSFNQNKLVYSYYASIEDVDYNVFNSRRPSLLSRIVKRINDFLS